MTEVPLRMLLRRIAAPDLRRVLEVMPTADLAGPLRGSHAPEAWATLIQQRGLLAPLLDAVEQLLPDLQAATWHVRAQVFPLDGPYAPLPATLVDVQAPRTLEALAQEWCVALPTDWERAPELPFGGFPDPQRAAHGVRRAWRHGARLSFPNRASIPPGAPLPELRRHPRGVWFSVIPGRATAVAILPLADAEGFPLVFDLPGALRWCEEQDTHLDGWRGRFRLPREEEWVAWAGADSRPAPQQAALGLRVKQRVGCYEPGPWGLHDMFGCAWEWADAGGAYLRLGGAFDSAPGAARHSYRTHANGLAALRPVFEPKEAT
jgi:hypothetical protein